MNHYPIERVDEDSSRISRTDRKGKVHSFVVDNDNVKWIITYQGIACNRVGDVRCDLGKGKGTLYFGRHIAGLKRGDKRELEYLDDDKTNLRRSNLKIRDKHTKEIKYLFEPMEDDENGVRMSRMVGKNEVWCYIDKDKMEEMSKYSWDWDDTNKQYIRTRIGHRGPHIRMHRLLLGLSKGDPDVDHINRIKNDNRLCNLRAVSRCDQMMNVDKLPNKTSRFKGVSFHKNREGRKKWKAQLQCKEVTQPFLGWFETEEEAARAYDDALDQCDKNTAIRNEA